MRSIGSRTFFTMLPLFLPYILWCLWKEKKGPKKLHTYSLMTCQMIWQEYHPFHSFLFVWHKGCPSSLTSESFLWVSVSGFCWIIAASIPGGSKGERGHEMRSLPETRAELKTWFTGRNKNKSEGKEAGHEDGHTQDSCISLSKTHGMNQRTDCRVIYLVQTTD